MNEITQVYTTEYDAEGVLCGPNLEVGLFDYWHECRMFRRTREIDFDIFEGCMAFNLDQLHLPYVVRRKISRFTKVDMPA